MGRSWRFVATVLAFAAFGVAAVLVNVLYFLPLRLLVPAGATRQRWARAGIRVSFKVFLQLVALLGVIKLDLDREALARLGGRAPSSSRITRRCSTSRCCSPTSSTRAAS